MRLYLVIVTALSLFFQIQARTAPTVSGFSVSAKANQIADYDFGQIWRYDITNGVVVKKSVIFPGQGKFAMINPDGQRVCFLERDSGFTDQTPGATICGSISVIPAAGGARSKVVTGLSFRFIKETFLDWPTGDWIFYGKVGEDMPVDISDGTVEIWKVNVVTREKVRVCKILGGDHVWQCTISNDGKRAICGTKGTSGSVYRFTLQDSIKFTPYDSNWVPEYGCGDAISPNGNYLVAFAGAGHQDLNFKNWNKTPLWHPRMVDLNGYGTYVGEGMNSNRWSCNDDKWLCLEVGWDGRQQLMGSNQVLFNWIDSQTINVSSDSLHPIPNGLIDAGASLQNETGDFWVDHSTTATTIPTAEKHCRQLQQPYHYSIVNRSGKTGNLTSANVKVWDLRGRSCSGQRLNTKSPAIYITEKNN